MYHNHLEGNQTLCTKIGLFESLRSHLGTQPGVYGVLPFAHVVRKPEDLEIWRKEIFVQTGGASDARAAPGVAAVGDGQDRR